MAEIKLITSSGTERTFTEQEVPDLPSHGAYKTAEVIKGTFIFYSNKNFNPDGPGNHLIIEGAGPPSDISKVNGSYYCLPDTNEGVVLFAHPNFGGHHQWYEDNCGDITKNFPPGQAGGVSAAIVLSKNQAFELYTDVYYKGNNYELHPGKIDQYADLASIIGDRVKSLRKI